MGNAQSGLVYRKLAKELPPVKEMGHDENYKYLDLGMKVFANDKDREQFCYAVIAVATNNGLIDLADHDFKLLYSRRPDNQERIVATLVAVKDGTIRAKIVPELDGADQTEAFKAFRKDVEVKLDHILQSVPSGSSSSAAISNTVRADAPPAYTTDSRLGSVGGKKA